VRRADVLPPAQARTATIRSRGSRRWPVLPPQPLCRHQSCRRGRCFSRFTSASYGPRHIPGLPALFSTSSGPRQNANSAYAAVIRRIRQGAASGCPSTHLRRRPSNRADFTFVDNAVHANLLAARPHGKHRRRSSKRRAAGARISVKHARGSDGQNAGKSPI